MVAGSASECMKQIRRDDSDCSSGVASVEVGDSRLLLREVGADGKVPKNGAGWSMEGDGGERPGEEKSASGAAIFLKFGHKTITGVHIIIKCDIRTSRHTQCRRSRSRRTMISEMCVR